MSSAPPSPARIVRLKAKHVKENDPPIRQIVAYMATMPSTKLPEFDHWVKMGPPTGQYTTPPYQHPTYSFTGVFSDDDIDTFGDRASCMVHYLEICFGARVQHWSIWARGDRMLRLMQQINMTYQSLQRDKADLRLVDEWAKDIYQVLKKIYEGDDMAELTPTTVTKTRKPRAAPSPIAPRSLGEDLGQSTRRKRGSSISLSPSTKRKSPAPTELSDASDESADEQPPPKRKTASKTTSKRKQPATDDHISISSDSSDNEDHTPSPSKRPKKASQAAAPSPKRRKKGRAPNDVFGYFRDGVKIPNHPKPLMRSYKCLHCDKSSIAENSTNLIKHRAVCKGAYAASRANAPGCLPNVPNPLGDQATLTTSGNLKAPFNQRRFTGLVSDWVAADGRPFSIVESASLQKCITSLEPLARLPSASTVRRRIIRMYESGRAELLKLLSNITTTIHYAYDAWTTPSKTSSLLGIIAFYCDDDFVQHQVLLGLLEVNGSHAGKEMGNAIYDTLKGLGIEKRVGPGTGDNASANLTTAAQVARRLKSDHKIKTRHTDLVGCIPHTINLAAQAYIRFEALLSSDDYPEDYSPSLPAFALHLADDNVDEGVKILGDLDRTTLLGTEDMECAEDDEMDDVAIPSSESGDESDSEDEGDGAEEESELLVFATQKELLKKLTKAQIRARHDNSPLGMVHNLGKFIGSSPQRRARFHRLRRKHQRSLKGKPIPSKDVETRWDSKCFTVARCLLLEPTILKFVSKYRKVPGCPQITDDTFDALRAIHPTLQIFLRLTKKYSADRVLVQDYISDLHDAVTEIRLAGQDLPPVRRASCEAAAQKLEKYIGRALQNDWLCAAFALDPRIRQRGLVQLLEHYEQSERLEPIVKSIKDRIAIHTTTLAAEAATASSSDNSGGNPATIPKSLGKSKSFADSSFDATVTLPSSPSDLWSAYNSSEDKSLSVRLLDQGKDKEKVRENPIQYWARLNHGDASLQPLCRFAKDVLALPASSASVERLFSHAGNVYGRKRGSLLSRSLVAQTSVRIWRRQGMSSGAAAMTRGLGAVGEEEEEELYGIALDV